MIDPPGRAMRPIDPYTIAHLAAEQDIARHAERLRLRVEQGILDRTEPLTDNASGGRPGETVELGKDPFVVEDVLPDDPRSEPFDDGTDPRGSETLVELAPGDDAVVGGQLEEMIIPPAGVTAEDFETRHLHRRAPVARGTGRG